jgi:hypothetical protein
MNKQEIPIGFKQNVGTIRPSTRLYRGGKGRMNRPTGVTVISILYFLGTALCLLFGLIFIAGGGFLATIMNQQAQAGASGMAGIMAGLGAALGVFFIVIGAVDGLVGWGLLKLKNWARIVALVLSVLGACSQLFGLLRSFSNFNIVSFVVTLMVLALHVWIITYLLKPEVKAAFQGPQAQAMSA